MMEESNLRVINGKNPGDFDSQITTPSERVPFSSPGCLLTQIKTRKALRILTFHFCFDIFWAIQGDGLFREKVWKRQAT
jgi:hypothetical protein